MGYLILLSTNITFCLVYTNSYLFDITSMCHISGIGICLEDTPAQKEFDKDATKLIGLEFNADKQCRAQYGPNAVSCPFKFALDVRSSLCICTYVQ